MAIIDHPVFRDFKHVSAEYDISICYPPGAGGNFLAQALISPDTNTSNAVNEFNKNIARIAYHEDKLDFIPIWRLTSLPLDQDSDSTALRLHLDKLHSMLSSDILARRGQLSNPRVMIGHYSPWFMSKILDYRCGEFFFVDPNPECHWVIRGLSLIKNLFSPEWHTKSSNIAWLLNVARKFPMPPSSAEYNSTEYINSVEPICAQLGIDRFRYGYGLWMYYVKSRCGDARMDERGFRAMISGMLQIDYPEYYSDPYNYVRTELGKQSRKCFTRSYDQLYFDLDVPYGSLLAGIDRDIIRSYSQRNIDQLWDFTALLSDDIANRCRAHLASLQARLNSA